MNDSADKRGAKKLRGPHRETLLQRKLEALGIPSARLEERIRGKLKRRNPDRYQFSRWRLGRSEPNRKDMVRILWGKREVSGDPQMRVEEIFDLDTDNPENWED